MPAVPVLLLLSMVLAILSVSALRQPQTRSTPLERPSSPYAWCDLGERLEENGDLRLARICFERARELGPHIAPTLLRVANFHLRQNDVQATLQTGRQIMEQTSEFDQILFSMYDHLDVERPVLVYDGIPDAPDRRFAYLRYLLSHGKRERFCAIQNAIRKVDLSLTAAIPVSAAADLVWSHLPDRCK